MTLLGIVFFFVLAVNRGWIGPEARVALGGLAAAIVYGAGIELRRRYGETHSALAAVGTGIAGGYMVLLAAAQMYDLVGHAAALAIASAIAALAVATALRWHSQMIAGIGLLGAMLAPAAVAVQDGLSATGVGFAAFMALATAIVAIRERWDVLLVAGAAASLPQAFALAMQPEYRGQAAAGVVALSAIFAGITVGSGIARQLRARWRELLPLPTSFLFVGASFAVACALRLYGSPSHAASRCWRSRSPSARPPPCSSRAPRSRPERAPRRARPRRRRHRLRRADERQPARVRLGGEAAVLAWLALRVRDIRYQLFALVYFGAAIIHVLAIDVTPAHLFKPLETSAGGALAIVAVGAVRGPDCSADGAEEDRRSRRVAGSSRRSRRSWRSSAPGRAECESWPRGSRASPRSTPSRWVCSRPSRASTGATWPCTRSGARSGSAPTRWVSARRRDVIRSTGLAWLVLTNVAAIANGVAELGSSARAAACLVAGLALLVATLVELFALIAPRYRSLSADARMLWLRRGVRAPSSCRCGAVGRDRRRDSELRLGPRRDVRDVERPRARHGDGVVPAARG